MKRISAVILILMSIFFSGCSNEAEKDFIKEFNLLDSMTNVGVSRMEFFLQLKKVTYKADIMLKTGVKKEKHKEALNALAFYSLAGKLFHEQLTNGNGLEIFDYGNDDEPQKLHAKLKEKQDHFIAVQLIDVANYLIFITPSNTFKTSSKNGMFQYITPTDENIGVLIKKGSTHSKAYLLKNN